MAFTNYFYHGLTRKYVAVMGTVFNKITIKRFDDGGNVLQSIPVPISFGPWQKFLLRNVADPNLSQKYQTFLPRMSFDLDNITYDNNRKSSQLNRLSLNNGEGQNFVYNPVPYNFHFTLYIDALTIQDGAQILEQITPFFQPNYTPSVFLIDGLEQSVDIPIDLVAVSYEDIYEGSYEDTRFVRWTLMFTLKGFFFGPTKHKNIIKFIDIKNKLVSHDNTSVNGSSISIQPGLDANGNPTDDIDETINYVDIEQNDNWDIISQLHVFEELEEKGLLDVEFNPHETNGKI